MNFSFSFFTDHSYFSQSISYRIVAGAGMHARAARRKLGPRKVNEDLLGANIAHYEPCRVAGEHRSEESGRDAGEEKGESKFRAAWL